MKRTNTKGIRLGAAIRRMRRERSLTQKRLASILGISTPYLNLIENNRRNVTGKILIILAQEFNIELADIGKENDANLLSDIMEVFMGVFPLCQRIIDLTKYKNNGTWCIELIHSELLDLLGVVVESHPISVSLPRF